MSQQRLALVLSGGGARGAYEAGVLNYIRTALPEPYCNARFDIITGTSVGAINAAFLASTADVPRTQGERLRRLWSEVDQDSIYQRDWASLARSVVRSSWGITRNVIRRDPGDNGANFRSVFNTAPLPAYLKKLVAFERIAENVELGHLDALGLVATSLHTDQPELFIQMTKDAAYRGPYRWHRVSVGVEHVLASASIPIAFPPVKIGNIHYVDGSLRLNTPMSPAIHLGADRILVIGMHTPGGNQPYPKPDDAGPGAGRLLASITEAIFQDRIESDLEQLGRINRIIRWAEAVYGPDFLDRINAYLKSTGKTGDVADRGLKKIGCVVLNPSRDLSIVFQEQLSRNPYFDRNFSQAERFAMRLLDMDPREGREMYSFLVFAPSYLHALLRLGYQDAHARRDDLISFFSGAELPSTFHQLEAG